jgi:hypothetical protein
MRTRAIVAALRVQDEAVGTRLTVQACMDAHEQATLRRDSTVGL